MEVFSKIKLIHIEEARLIHITDWKLAKSGW